MMTLILLFLVLVLMASMIVGLIRVVSGPTQSDRMLAAQLMGTIGVGILLLLAKALDRPALVDLALVFALLAAITGIAFVKRFGPRHAEIDEPRFEHRKTLTNEKT